MPRARTAAESPSTSEHAAPRSARTRSRYHHSTTRDQGSREHQQPTTTRFWKEQNSWRTAQINAKDVMSLRNETGLAMMDCKKALGEVRAATSRRLRRLLRKKLKGKMEGRTDRVAGEGAHRHRGQRTTGPTATIVEFSRPRPTSPRRTRTSSTRPMNSRSSRSILILSNQTTR